MFIQNANYSQMFENVAHSKLVYIDYFTTFCIFHGCFLFQMEKYLYLLIGKIMFFELRKPGYFFSSCKVVEKHCRHK